ncbi:MAG TPA: hypothetical protein PLZ69_02830 [Candidatus Pacearchaeota archaeon]|nr:hypothetical protein [Candidatus Pacearchaeota archaeon]
MEIRKIEISKPKCDDNCKECKYYEQEDNSFDHEFGTEYRVNDVCNFDFVKYNGYGDCYKVTDFIDNEELNYNYLVNVLEVE